MKNNKTFRFLAAACAAAALSITAHAATFVKDVMLIGGTKYETDTLKTNLTSQGWTFINNDLNKGASGDYIYLLYKAENTPGGNSTLYDHVTGFYLKSGASDVNDTLSYGGKTYYLTPHDGGSHFRAQKGDLNSGTGSGSDSIHLYYTKDDFSPECAVSSIWFNDTQSGAVGKNGGSTGYDLNHNASGDFIYMHVSTGAASSTIDVSKLDVSKFARQQFVAANGMVLTGTLCTPNYMRIAEGATVTFSNMTVAVNSQSWQLPGVWCLGDAHIVLAGVNSVTSGKECGIHIPSGNSLLIDGSGTLDVVAGYGPGIGAEGANQSSCGNITINGGTVTVTKGNRADYSIGPCNSGSCGTITIGNVTTGPIRQNPVTYSSTDTTSYTISFNGNGGSGTTSAIVSRRNTPKQIPANGFTRAGYSFTEWNSAANGGGTSYGIGDWVLPWNTTIYAQWTVVPYTIGYNLNYGALPSGTSNPTSYNVETATFTLNNPTRSYYDFAGWTGTGLSSARTTVTISKGSTGNRSYTATWTPVTYNIGYTLNGGTLPNSRPTSYTIESANITLVNPTRTGYTFAGWTGTGLSSPQTTVTIPRGSTGNRTYTANWTPVTYNIGYNLKNGTLPSGYPSSYNIESAVTLVNPTRTGYNFAGWTGSNGNTPQTSVTIAKGSTGDRSYTANWTTITYNITYNLDSGSLPSGSPTSYNVESANFTLVNPTRTGYTFAGWTGTGLTSAQTAVTIAKGSTGNRTYTAHWTPVTYTIGYDLAGGALPGGSSNPTSYNIESAAITLVNPAPRTGYTFDGWTGTGLSSAQTAVTIPTGSYGDRSYTASWTPVEYTISYDLAEGQLPNGTTNPAAYNVESADITLAAPERPGYDFAGWTGTGLSSAQTTVTISTGSTGDKSYTANWTPRTVDVVFESNGGAGEMAPQTFTTDVPQELASNAFIRAEYLFFGWNTAADGSGTPYADGQDVTLVATNATMSVYAQWTPVTYALTPGSGEVMLIDGQTLTGAGGEDTHVVIAAGATVTFSDVDLSETEGGWAGVTCLGDATIILEGDSAVMSGDASHPAVQAGPAGTTLAIQGSGSLSAVGGTAAISVVAGGELSLADGLMVTVAGGAAPAAYADRADACGETAVAIGPCGHGGGVFEDTEGVSHCEFCGTELFVLDGGSGTEDDPWIIRTTKAWDTLANGVATEIVTNFCFVRLDADITVTNLLGSWSHPFKGVFNGGGHKLTLNLSSSVDYVAPFSVISGTVVSNLVSAGTVNGGMHCAGLVGCAFATNLIKNCLVSTKITTTGSHCGGVLGNGCLSSTTIAGCVFSGSIPSGLTAGTIWGWSDPGSEATLIDCYASGVNYHPIGRGANSSRRVENVYYYLDAPSGGSYAWNIGELGKCAHTVSRDFGVTIDFGDPVTSYGTSKLVAYAHGFRYNGNFFAGAGDVIPMSLSSNSGVSSPEFIVEDGLLVRDGDFWVLTMPDAAVVIKEKPPVRYEIVLQKVAHANPDYEICVNENWTYTYAAVSNAQVTAVYAASGPAWTIESFTVVAEDGTTVPCTMERLGLGVASVSFQMPDMSVTVTPTVVPTSCTEMSLGVNEIAVAGVFSFVAPTNGVYSFTLGNTTDWHYEPLDEMGLPPPSSSEDQFILIGGQTYYFLFEGDGAATAMTVVEIGEVDAYPVEVVQAEHGTVVASVSEAPEGSHVYFTIKPDRGWVSYYADAFDADGNKVDICYNFDGSQCYIEMPASAVSFEAHFDRDYTLYVGENLILFTDTMPNCFFIAPYDGYYRFRSTCGGYPDIDIDSSKGSVAYEHSDSTGNFDCVVYMEAGVSYFIYVEFDSSQSVSVEAELIVSRCTDHSLSVDDDIPNGTISAVDEYGHYVDEAVEGSEIRLEADPSQGYEFGGWNVVDESGASVEVLWNSDSDYWYFKMPGTNVFVSATFGEPNYITAFSSGPESVDSIFINGVWSDSWSAVEGAKVAVVYWVTPGWDPATFTVVDDNGANIPYIVKIDPDDPNYALVTFTMPNANVEVSTVLSRADCPTLAIGVNAIDTAGTWNFVAPEDGVYSFAFGDTSEWYGTLYDDWGWSLNSTYSSDVFTVELAKGNVCHLQMECSDDALPNEVTVTKTDGVVVTHSVVFNVEHCTVLTNAVALPEGYIFAFELHPEPGYDVSNIAVEDADGSGVSMYSYEELYYFFMPETNVTVTVTMMVPLPRYIANADDDIVDNYYAWAAKYGPDPLGTNEVAFLLDIDPATPIPTGASFLKVTDFSVSPTNIHFEIASDVAEFELKDIGEGDYSYFLGNGYPQIEFKMSPSSDWISMPPIPVRVVNGRGIIDIDTDGGLPPGLFFRVSIIVGDMDAVPIME